MVPRQPGGADLAKLSVAANGAPPAIVGQRAMLFLLRKENYRVVQFLLSIFGN